MSALITWVFLIGYFGGEHNNYFLIAAGLFGIASEIADLKKEA